jgi:chromosomal replication initiator protein
VDHSLDQQLWEKTLARLKSNVDEESFVTWLRPTRLLEVHDNTVTLSVPNSFFKNWLLSNYRDKIERALQEVTERDVNVEFYVTGTGEPVYSTDVQMPTQIPSETGGAAPESLTLADQAQLEQRSSSLNRKYTFDNFVVGESNRFAHAACRQVSEPASRSYNPLFLYGGVGLGKTHLMHAIGHQILQTNSSLRVLYVTSEQFMNSFIESISQGKQFAFRDFYRNVDLLLIDDVQFFSGKERTQTEFFHTFNALYDAGKRIVVSSDRSPKELTMLEDRLRNRFAWGLVVDIQAPDLETRIAILKKKAYMEGTEIPNEVTVYIAERVQSNIRELEGVLVRLKAYSLLHKQPITLPLAQDVLGVLLESNENPSIDIEEIIETVCSYFDVKRSDLIGTSRLKKFSGPRHIAQYLTRKLTTLSYPEIAQRFGGRDHTSVLHAFKKIDEESQNDNNLKNLITYLTKRVRGSRQPAP